MYDTRQKLWNLAIKLQEFVKFLKQISSTAENTMDFLRHSFIQEDYQVFENNRQPS